MEVGVSVVHQHDDANRAIRGDLCRLDTGVKVPPSEREGAESKACDQDDHEYRDREGTRVENLLLELFSDLQQSPLPVEPVA